MEIKNMNMAELTARLAEIKTEMTAEDADFSALKDEVDAIEARKAELATAEAERRALAERVAAGVAGKTKETHKEGKKEMNIEELRKSAEYNHAFANFIRTGNDAECRALTTNLVNTGDAIVVPTVVSEGVERAWHEQPILREIRRVYVKGVLSVPVEVAAGPAVEHTENGVAPNEEDLTIVNITITPTMLKKWLSITDELLKMTDDRLLQYVRDEIAQRIVELAVTKVVAAAVASTETGGVNASNIVALTADPTLADILGVMALAEHVEDGAWLMQRADFFGKIMAMTDQNDRPIWNVISENGKPQYFVLGAPVRFVTLPTGYTRFYGFGDLGGIVGNFPDGESPEILVDPYTLATEDKVRVIGKLLAGFAAVKPDGFAMAATAST